MSNKFIPYGHQYIEKDDIDEVLKVLRSDWITQGPKVKEFEDVLCKYTGAKYAVCVCNATAALHLACIVAGINIGDEVITPPITFVATANSIIYCGGTPVFADIQADTVNVDPVEIKKKINKKTKAIIPVHFAGHPCDLEEIYEIAGKHNLVVIEDASHALGAEYRGSKIGSCKYSDMTVFSFHPVKLITTGEGGAILTNRKDLYEKLVLLRNHGITKDKSKFINFNILTDGDWYYEMQDLGFNYRLTDIQCALGINQLKKLDSFIKKRKKIVDIYNSAFSNNNNFILPIKRPEIKSAWHIYYLRLKKSHKRLRLFNYLREKKIGCQIHYIPVYLQPYYRKKFRYRNGLCPKAENYYQQTITLPLYPHLINSEIYYIIKTVKTFNYEYN